MICHSSDWMIPPFSIRPSHTRTRALTMYSCDTRTLQSLACLQRDFHVEIYTCKHHSHVERYKIKFGLPKRRCSVLSRGHSSQNQKPVIGKFLRFRTALSWPIWNFVENHDLAVISWNRIQWIPLCHWNCICGNVCMWCKGVAVFVSVLAACKIRDSYVYKLV